jgi:hypothetical protein
VGAFGEVFESIEDGINFHDGSACVKNVAHSTLAGARKEIPDCSNSPPVEGWQAKPDGVVSCEALTTPTLRVTPPVGGEFRIPLPTAYLPFKASAKP